MRTRMPNFTVARELFEDHTVGYSPIYDMSETVDQAMRKRAEILDRLCYLGLTQAHPVLGKFLWRVKWRWLAKLMRLEIREYNDPASMQKVVDILTFGKVRRREQITWNLITFV